MDMAGPAMTMSLNLKRRRETDIGQGRKEQNHRRKEREDKDNNPYPKNTSNIRSVPDSPHVVGGMGDEMQCGFILRLRQTEKINQINTST